jgi:hypothetical protein
MKAETIERNIQRSANFEERSMGLAVGSEAFVFNVLRKDLYSDPIGSLIREYTANAMDEHRKHGKTDVPILIKVPNTFEPELHIRDYANGLTEEQVFEFFGNYGASDKRDSNVAVGFFGLGCKSAFAYTDSYIVKSFKDGKVYTFNVYIDETEIGRVAKIADERTTEPNGVLIIVPAKTRDINEFQSKVIDTVTYFKVKPTIEGLAYEPEFEKKRPVIVGKGWEFYGKGEPIALMGEIAYPIDIYKFDSVELAEWEKQLLRSDLHIFTNIGEVQVTASREALQMSPKTIQAIRNRLIDIKAEMLTQTTKKFDDVKTLFEAKSLYYDVAMHGGGYSEIIRQSGNPIIWNGIQITDNSIRFGEMSPHRVVTYKNNWRGKITSDADHTLKCGGDIDVYFDDTNKTKVNYMRRAKTLLAGKGRDFTVAVVQTTDIPALEKIIGMKVAGLKSYNAVTPTMPVTMSRGGTGIDLAKRGKHTAKMFVLKADKLREFEKGIASELWEIKEVDVRKGGIFIPIERFHPTLSGVDSLQSLRDILFDLKAIGVNTDAPIYGVKAGAETGKLIRFDKWLTKKVDALTKQKDELALVQAFSTKKAFDVTYVETETLPDGLTKEYVELYKVAKKLYNDAKKPSLVRSFRTAGIEVKTDTKISELSAYFTEKYPMVTLVNEYSRNRKEVTDYILERCSEGE